MEVMDASLHVCLPSRQMLVPEAKIVPILLPQNVFQGKEFVVQSGLPGACVGRNHLAINGFQPIHGLLKPSLLPDHPGNGADRIPIPLVDLPADPFRGEFFVQRKTNGKILAPYPAVVIRMEKFLDHAAVQGNDPASTSCGLQR